MGSLIRTTHLWGYKELVEELGGDAAAFMTRFHIASSMAHDPDAFMPYHNMAQLLETSAAELGCPDFGLRLSRWQGLDTLGPIAVIARNARTVEAAFKAIGRYLHVHAPALHISVGAAKASDKVRLNFEIIEPSYAHQAQVCELSMANCMQILRILAGPSAAIDAVHFYHARVSPSGRYRKFFGCPVKFEQTWCGYYLDHRLAQRRISTADPETHRLATKYFESQYAPGSVSLSTQVLELIRRLLSTGHCSMAAVAQLLAVHPRTLQRWLRVEGTGFDTLLDRHRREQAVHYLGQLGLCLNQIAGLLGYTEQSSFNRAFRRWYGTTPRQFRLTLLQRS